MSTLKGFARFFSFAGLLVICGGITFAQDNQGKQTPPAPSGLSLEVNTKEGPVGYQTVPGHSFGGRYKRLASWKPGAGVSDPQSFELRKEVDEGGAVRVKVFAIMDKFHEQKLLIGDYLMREGERVTVDGMAKFGYEPMELSVVKVKAPPLVLPEVATRIPSVVALNVEAMQSDFPSFKVTLRNLSDKDITFLEVQSFRGDRLATSRWPRGEKNSPLIKAGETYDLSVSGGGVGMKDSDGYTPSLPNRIEVVTAVFADNTYEGDKKSAAGFVAILRGQREQIKSALPLLQAAAGVGESDARSALANLKKQVGALGREAQQTAIDEILAGFQDLPPKEVESLKLSMEAGLDQARKELLKDINEYSQARERAPESNPFGVWIRDLKGKYEAWLSRL